MAEISTSAPLSKDAEEASPSARSLFWLKTTDPETRVPELGEETDARVILPAHERFRPLRERLTDRGISVRGVPYWLEQETISGTPTAHDMDELTSEFSVSVLSRGGGRGTIRRSGEDAAVARDAFDALWESHSLDDRFTEPVPVERAVPASWVPFLPHATLNPAQAQAAPEVVKGEDNLLVVAPTGAGKTTIGMLAALRTVLSERRKAAWLVPQRSLTDELDREFEAWRGHGLRVERLSGERSVDARRVRDADLWVTTTEKFEALCRTSSLREALDEVGCLIVDEVHLLGDVERGPVLEALLARMRGADSDVRMIGLSATVSNADQVADWLRARLLRIAWRPSQLTWQLPAVPAAADRNVAQAARTRVTNAIVDMVTADDGSVLVFCGSKHSARSTALALAASRGADTSGIRPDNLDELHRITRMAGIGLHYKDWDHKKEAEQAFRNRELDVLVATSTVAAGVNLPARAVVVRDTQIGLRDVDVATVQQMFGRAGRVGAGEREGWAFLIVDEAERAEWQRRLVGGYTIGSRISSSLPDHVLAEAVQERIRTRADAERWWLSTFAHHQGMRSVEPLHRALNFLIGADYLSVVEEKDGDITVQPTELGLLTARVMVPVVTGHQLRTALTEAAVPTDAEEAERSLIETVATTVPKIARAPLPEQLKPAVAALIRAEGRLRRLPDGAAGHETEPPATPYEPGDLAVAALLSVANSPHDFSRPRREFASIPHSTMYPVLEDAPRYLYWLGSQGHVGTVHPWVAIVATDLSRRIRWRRCAPPRGSGRLLWMCEHMATPAHADEVVPQMWAAARQRGLTAPDWPTRTPPQGCALDPAAYEALLRERVAGDELMAPLLPESTARPAPGRVRVTWQGASYDAKVPGPLETDSALPADASVVPQPGRGQADGGASGVAVFSRWGDHRATGWLAAYCGARFD